MTNKACYFDMDGVLVDFHSEFDYKKRAQQALNRQWIASRKPFEANVATVKRLIAEGKKVYILTLAANEAARLGKIDWLAKYIPEIDINNFICIVGHGKKVDHIKEDGILIDDDKKNTNPWIKAGYEAILLEEKGQAVQI